MDGSKGFEDVRTGEQTIRNFNLNVGPQHPATHGVLRLVTELDGEIVERADPHIGLLHRGTEKLMESRTYLQNAPYMDRLDYSAPMNQEHSFCLAIEKMTGVQAPRRSQLLRVLMAELSRIGNHVMNVTTAAMDVGALTPPLWGFELGREEVYTFFERASGARMHCNYFRPGGVHQDVTPDLLDDIEAWAPKFLKVLDDLDGLLTENRIFKQRTVDICVVSEQDVYDWAMTGPMARSAGLAWDLRRTQPYDLYDEFDFQIPLGKNGDCYDRYLLRMEEMRQSTSIVLQAIEKLRAPDGQGDVLARGKLTPPKRADMKTSMEALIHHFKLYSEGFKIPAGEIYCATEAPKGEMAVYIVSDGSNKPYRLRLRTPGFAHLQTTGYYCKGHQLADIPAVIGTLDIVFGEIDR
ncbi:NADH-quinone oxidoreductase subunit D [Aliiruegeria lutimaris]|uniref:NADH-quinone oxidoreductase subunit D n=1 Tax=Aliiruegeria lutimaris TaxID=571298 RepID=A0A1G8J5Q5_9RHOB|nr:NADH-quinone oxidoreductase subunit D [Aliiruegeria lutimaris]SDI26363.1 NADH dehydrogenase subunit D [Aliiruegeria lutimaris]